MRTAMSLMAVAVLLVTAGCSSAIGPGNVRLAELEQQRSKWEQSGLNDYVFEYHHQFGGAIAAVLIHVVDGNVAEVTDLPESRTVDAASNTSWPTVESLFAEAESALSSKGTIVDISYDATLGYPSRISVSPEAATPAGGSSTVVSDLRAYTPGGTH